MTGRERNRPADDEPVRPDAPNQEVVRNGDPDEAPAPTPTPAPAPPEPPAPEPLPDDAGS